MNEFARATGGFKFHACTLIREETREVYSGKRPIQWITIMCIQRHVSLIEMCVIRRLSPMFVPKLVDYFFLWRKMPSSMKVTLSTSIKQLISSTVISDCMLQCILAGVSSFSTRQSQKISFSIHG